MTKDEAREETRAYRVHGRVQGVGFRWWTRRAAERIGIRGHVRNLPSGVVEVHAAGTPDQLAELEALLAAGPPMASVTRVEPAEPEPGMPQRGFHIDVR